MAEKNRIYRCGICGNIVSVIEAHEGELVCCGKPMALLEEKAPEQEGKEKHVPVIELKDGRAKVTVGSIPHPMEEKHFIEYIEILSDGKPIAAARLYPGQKPEAEFCVGKAEGLSARELCNIHGMWKSG